MTICIEVFTTMANNDPDTVNQIACFRETLTKDQALIRCAILQQAFGEDYKVVAYKVEEF
jgi:hypothetical protein